jgi:hypothetical protein
MDKITIICEDEMHDKIQTILRQTDYSECEAREKLIENCGDHIKVIKTFMGIPDKNNTSKKSLNQEIYRQLRSKLDNSIKDFNKKQEEKLTREISANLNK